MKQAIKCALKLHNFEVYKEETIVDAKDNPIGKIIINRCKHCGKLNTKRIILTELYR